jgi:hypothetical protein
MLSSAVLKSFSYAERSANISQNCFEDLDGFAQSPRSRRANFALRGVLPVRRSSSEMQRNAEIGLSAKPSLIVARQPAVHTGLFLAMAFDANPHAPDLIGKPLQVLNLPVAHLAGHLAVDVALVVEKDMLGDIIHLDPGVGVWVLK